MKKSLFILSVLLFSLNFLSAEKITFPVNAEETLHDEPVNLTVEWNEKKLGVASPKIYHHDLARVAAILSEVSYVNLEKDPELNQLKKVYRKLGVSDDKMTFHYDLDYDKVGVGINQTAFSFASKKIVNSKGQEKVLVFVTIRGTPQRASEWVSNVNISDSARKDAKIHEGFYQAELQIHNHLIYYLLTNKIAPQETVLFITGHSRGAAVANLLGARLADKNYFDTENIYVYTFASPNVITVPNVSDEKYKFIWNIVNPEDVVPTVPLRRGKWDFKKFGQVKVFVNRWSAEESIFFDNYLKKINSTFNQIMKRDYYPFHTGTFIPSGIAKLITQFYPDVKSYYSSGIALRSIAESVLNKMFPPVNPEIQLISDEDKKKTPTLLERFEKFLNKDTVRILNYSEFAFLDMHIMSTYLSFMLSLDEEDLFSELGSSRVFIKGTFEAAVFNKKGELVCKILDGIPVIDSVRVPVIAFPFFNGTVIGFPSTSEYRLVIYKDSLLPTLLPVSINHYDAEGYLVDEHKSKILWPHSGSAYIIDVGKRTLTESEVSPIKTKPRTKGMLVRESKLRQRNFFRVQPEMSYSFDGNIELGCRFGTSTIHGGLYTDQSTTSCFGNQLDITGTLGNEFCLFSQTYIGFDFVAKNMWIVNESVHPDKVFNFIPGFRLSLSWRPFHRSAVFVSGNFSFKIRDFNHSAFFNDVRKISMGAIEFNDDVSLVPTISIGLRY